MARERHSEPEVASGVKRLKGKDLFEYLTVEDLNALIHMCDPAEKDEENKWVQEEVDGVQ